MRTLIVASNAFMETGSISLGRIMTKDQCQIYKGFFLFFYHGVMAIITALVKIHHIHTYMPLYTQRPEYDGIYNTRGN